LRGATMQVLIVEDEATLRRILARNLEQRGFEVSEAGSAAEAVGTCTQHAPDVVVLDINLPDASGWDVLRGLAARHIKRPAISAPSAVPPSRQRLEEFRPVVFLPKPFPIGALLRAVERAGSEVESHEPLDHSTVR